MEPQYIVMIVVGSIFLFILLLYIAMFIEHTSDRLHFERAQQIYYSSPNLTKMEYDIAYYAKDKSKQADKKQQVTMDEVINEKDKTGVDIEAAIFNPIEFEGSKEIIGHYNPDLSD